jgi:hypothetical protein
MAISKEDAAVIAEAINKAASKNSQKPQTSSGIPGVEASLKSVVGELDPFGKAVGLAGKGASAGLDALRKTVVDGLDSFRDLSKTGISFNNDIIGMTTAAAGTRLPLGEFGKLLKDNVEGLAGLGAGVGRGAEAFAKMSKSFFESGATDSLKQLGYTNKDLNEVLALQAITLRGKFKDDQQRDAVAIESATKLATEMDLMAKLTGKSREAQMETMKKQQADMQFEAAIRLKTQSMNAEEAAKFEANARQQFKDAEIRGQGQMFKEVFATGTITSKEAAMQASINQEQSNATMKQARASALGDEKAANAANMEARAAAVKDANDTSKLQIRIMGDAGGAAAKVMNDQAAVNNTYTRSMERIAAANGYDLQTKEGMAKAQEKLAEEAKKQAAGQNEQGKQVDGVTKATIAMGNTVDHVRAGLITGLLEPIRDKLGPELGKLGNNLTDLNKNFQGTGKNIGAAIEGAAKQGVANVGAEPTDRRTAPVKQDGALGVVEGAGALYGGGLGLVNKGLAAGNRALEKKATGGPVKENEPYIVGDGGEEEIFVPKTAGEIIPKSKLAPKPLDQSMKGGIDLNKISSDISTTVSGGNSSTVKMPDMKELTRPFEKSFADFSNNVKDIKPNIDTKELTKPFADFGNSIKDIKPSMSADVKETLAPLPSIKSASPDIESKPSVNPMESMVKMSLHQGLKGLNDEQAKYFDTALKSNKELNEAKIVSLREEQKAAYNAMDAAEEAKDAIYEKATEEKRALTDSEKAETSRLEAIRKSEQAKNNAAYDEIKAIESANKTKESLAKMGVDIVETAEKEKTKIVEQTSDKIKTDIADALPVKDIAEKTEAAKTVLSDHQKTVLKYAYEDTEGKQMQLENQKDLIKGELASIADKNKQIEDVQKEADGRELSQREKNRIEKLQKEIESGKETLKIREEELFVYANLDKLKAENEIATKKVSASVVSDQNEKIKLDINDAIPVDEMNDLSKALGENELATSTNTDTVVSNQNEKIKLDINNAIPFDEFAGVDKAVADQKAMNEATAAANPLKTQSSKITSDSFTLSASGMPIMKPKTTAAAVPEKKKDEEGKTAEEQAKDREAKAKADMAKGPQGEKSATGSDSKAATLDDLLKSLNGLNSKISQLISTTESGTAVLAKATKSNNANLYAK